MSHAICADGALPMTVERVMELVRTLPPRSMPEERKDYLEAIERMVCRLRDESARGVSACEVPSSKGGA